LNWVEYQLKMKFELYNVLNFSHCLFIFNLEFFLSPQTLYN